MSMDKRNDIDLRAAIPDTPDMCRDAVLQAVSTYQEEKAMRKPYKMILAAALVLMLLCGTAFAIVSYYSVRDYLADGQPSLALEEAIVPLETTATARGLSFTLGDAVFDGKDLVFTMTMAAAEDAAPLYIYPELRAFCGERELNVDYSGFDMAYNFGFLYPSATPLYTMDANRGITASLYRDTAEGEVTWQYTLHLYRPLGELVEISDWKPAEETFDAWEDGIRALHSEGKIACWHGVDISDYLDAVVTDSVPVRTFADRLMATGMFELADAITFEFTTAVPEKVSLTGPATFDFDGYTVTVKSISQSFLQVDYELEVVYDEPQPHEHGLEQFYALTDQDGNLLPGRGTLLELADDMVTTTVTGSVERISDEPLTAITFTLDHLMTIDQNDTAEDMPSFTVELAK